MGKIIEKSVPENVGRKVLNFLNGAQSINDLLKFTRVDLTEEVQIDAIRDIELAKNLLNTRNTKYEGVFTKIEQLNDVKGFDSQDLSELIEILDTKVPYAKVNIVEPLFRFATLRYHDYNASTAQSKASPKADAKVDTKAKKLSAATPAQIEVKHSDSPLKQSDKLNLEKAHIALLAEHEIQFVTKLDKKLTELQAAYFQTKNQALDKAQAAHDELIAKNVASYQKEIGAIQKGMNESSCEKGAFENYPSALFPELKFAYPSFLSLEYLKDKLADTELKYMSENQLFDGDETLFSDVLNAIIESKRIVASYPKLSWKRTVKVKGVELSLKKHYKNAYVFSRSTLANSFLLSAVVDKSGSIIENAKASCTVGGKTFKSTDAKLVSNDSRLLTFEISFKELPDLSLTESFEYNIQVQLNSGENIQIVNRVASQTNVWAGKYVNASQTAMESLTSQNFGTNTDLHGIIRLGWADLMRVEQQLCCYLPGEIAHIENIMAREYKEKSTELLERSENTYSIETETETTEKNDTTSVSKHDWNKEIKKTITNDFKLNFGTTVSYDAKPWSASITAGLSFANTRTQATNNSETFSKTITETASESIRTKVSEKRTTTLIKQFKEENKHGYDNRSGDKHVSGIFRWIDKEYKNTIVNYGKGMLYEFMVPKPSELYVESLSEETSSNTSGNGGTKPEDPGLKSWQEITRGNYLGLINRYQVTNFQAPLDEYKTDRFDTGFLEHEFDWADNGLNKSSATRQYVFPSQLASAYELIEVLPTSSYAFEYHNPFGDNIAIFQIYLKNTNTNRLVAERDDFNHISWNGTRSGNFSKTGLNFSNQVDVYILGQTVKKVNHARLNFRFKLNTAVYQQWQQDTYNAIMDAYNAQLQAYNAAQAQSQSEDDAAESEENYGKNPGFYREIVATELKRLCIDLLLQKSAVDRCKEFYTMTSCDDGDDCEALPELTNLDELDSYASIVKFVEQAFIWQLMDFNLYDYYWAGRCDWADMLHNEDTTDNDFQRFLKSGMARIIVPVREGFERVVGYFMSTGAPWLGGEPPVIDDPLYVSIVNELNTPVGIPGKPWKTYVPSALTLLQGSSAYLNEQGLPCCESGGRGNLLGSDIKLEGKVDDEPEKSN